MFSLSEEDLVNPIPLYGVDPAVDGRWFPVHAGLQAGPWVPVPSVEVEGGGLVARLPTAGISREVENVVVITTGVAWSPSEQNKIFCLCVALPVNMILISISNSFSHLSRVSTTCPLQNWTKILHVESILRHFRHYQNVFIMNYFQNILNFPGMKKKIRGKAARQSAFLSFMRPQSQKYLFEKLMILDS